MMQDSIYQRRQSGFTLIEILLVVAIIGILSGVVVVSTAGYIEKTKRREAVLQIGIFKTAIAHFEMAVGRWPKNLEELVFEGDENWPGPFLDSETVPQDGWGNDYKMEKIGKRMHVTSPGKDGEFGTDDDLPERPQQ